MKALTTIIVGTVSIAIGLSASLMLASRGDEERPRSSVATLDGANLDGKPKPASGVGDTGLDAKPGPIPTGGTPERGSPPRPSPLELGAPNRRLTERRTTDQLGDVETASTLESSNEEGPEEVARMPALESGDPESAERLLSYMKDIVSEQFVPLAKECMARLRERFPDVHGEMVLETSISGAAAVGGVVESVEVAEGASLRDEDFVTCMQQSLYTLELDPPPDDNESVAVTFPIVMRPH